jgi:hypothetical protein
VSFYQKYRVPILITTGVLSSVLVAIAIDKIMKRKFSKKVKVSGSFTAKNCDELHAFEGTNGRKIGGMNTKVNEALEKFYNEGKNPIVSDVKVTMNAEKMKVDWEVTISESEDGKAYVGFTSRGSSGGGAFERAVAKSTGQDPETILTKLKSKISEPTAELKKVYELFYNMTNTGKSLGKCPTRQVFFSYTKPKAYPKK